MDEIADIVLKHDGIIWGPYVWSLLNGTATKKMMVRFIDKNVFNFSSVIDIPTKFMTDINENFTIKSFKDDVIVLDNGIEIFISVHNHIREIEFITTIDFTCNLLDYNRSGFHIRNIPECLEFCSSPYRHVKDHITNKELVPVNSVQAIKRYGLYPSWKPKKMSLNINIHKHDSDETCGICHYKFSDMCVTLRCSHIFHLECLSKWVDNGTCPMCRDQI